MINSSLLILDIPCKLMVRLLIISLNFPTQERTNITNCAFTRKKIRKMPFGNIQINILRVVRRGSVFRVIHATVSVKTTPSD
jgi:hypothetical protein